ncbi:MAG TPA: ACT domain-containing protein, partial [Terriglobales bacterium]|nr:ACT domain-containing protein [Terriglobales bacterium]
SRHYLRFTIKDCPGLLAQIATVLSKHDINIDAVLQHPGYERAHLPFVVTLDECPNSVVERAMEEVNALDFLVKPTLNLPILG